MVSSPLPEPATSADDTADRETTTTTTTVFKKRTARTGKVGRIGLSSTATTTATASSNDDRSKVDITGDAAITPTNPARAADDEKNDNDDATPPVSDLLALRSLTRRPTGIALDRLNAGEATKRTKKKKKSEAEMTKEERWDEQMRKGGLMVAASGGSRAEDDDDDERTAAEAKKLLRKDNFQSETGTVDVDKHMMAYIESELSKRRQHTAPWSSSATDDATSSSTSLSTTSLQISEDDLYRLSEKYRALQKSARALTGKTEKTQEEDEGNVTLSTAMLSSIPEIDLGMDSKMKNIEKTERAKRELAAKARTGAGAPGVGDERDEGFAGARFFRPAYQRTQTDAEASSHRPGGRSGTSSSGSTRGGANSVGGGGGGTRREMASDQFVLDRFKKRQRNIR